LPSVELDREFNDLVDYINAGLYLSVNTSDWITSGQAPTFIDTTHFSVPGDLTGIYAANRAIQPVLGGSSVYTYVLSSAYDSGSNITTVTTTSAVLTDQLSAVKYGVVKNNLSLPNNMAAATALEAAHADSATLADTATNALAVGGFTASQAQAPNRAVVSSANGDIDGWVGVSRGVAWVGHGENVITFNPALASGAYFPVAAILHDPLRNARNPLNNAPFTVTARMESASRMIVSLAGGFGFSTCGFTASVQGTTERFDDVANTHTARTAATARDSLAAYSLNGHGFTSCGSVSGVTERFDDTANSHTARGAATARRYVSGYSLNGYGFTSGGFIAAVSAVVERFDDVGNAHTVRTALTTARERLAAYSLNGYGFTSCGNVSGTPGVGTTERFDDVANAQPGRTDAAARRSPAGYSFNGYGLTTGGFTTVVVGTTGRFDDVGNAHTARTALTTAREELGGYCVNGYGFSTCGLTGSNTGITERFDDVANSHTGRTAATARMSVAGYSINEFFVGYVVHA